MIPHGTFTMNETAKVLEEALMRHGREKKVVLVGSLIPLGEPSSDAVENLAVAVQCLKFDQVILQNLHTSEKDQIVFANIGRSLDGDEWKALEGRRGSQGPQNWTF